MQIILIDETVSCAKSLAKKLSDSKNGEILMLTKDEMALQALPAFFRILEIENDPIINPPYYPQNHMKECPKCKEPVLFELLAPVE